MRMALSEWMAGQQRRWSSAACSNRRMNVPSYEAPSSLAELLRRYANGERKFPGVDLSGEDFSGVTLDGADFEPHSWFFDAKFDGASLRTTSFRECNVKCASFVGADLTGANFELAAIESIDLDGAILPGARFVGATFYGITLTESDTFP
jgi:uncharacterized protein YjbI with pentapeptide repeats